MSPTFLGMLPGSLALTRLLSLLSTMRPPLPSPIAHSLCPPFSPNSSPWLMTLVPLLPSGLHRLSPSPLPRQSAQPPPHHQPHPTWRRPSRTCPLVLLLYLHTARHKCYPCYPKRHPLPPLLSKPTLLSRRKNSPPASRLARSPPRTFTSSLRTNDMATRTHTRNATRTHPKRLSSSPLATPNQRKQNSTRSVTQPPRSSIPVLPPVSLFLIPRSPKNKPGQRLPGRAVRARRTPLQHKSLRQARVLSPKDPHRSQLLNFISLPPYLSNPPERFVHHECYPSRHHGRFT